MQWRSQLLSKLPRNTQVLLICACHLMVMHTVARNVLVCGWVEVEVGGEELCELV